MDTCPVRFGWLGKELACQSHLGVATARVWNPKYLTPKQSALDPLALLGLLWGCAVMLCTGPNGQLTAHTMDW